MAQNFIWDNTSLPADKTDIKTPTDPNRQWSADDANAVFHALKDIRSVFQAGEINVKAYGALGDASTPDSDAIQAALNAAALTVHGGYGAMVYCPKGLYVLDKQLTIPNGVGIRGDGPTATVFQAQSGFSGTSLIRNLTQNGTQEFAFLEGIQIQGNKGLATCSIAVVDWTSLFINSFIRDVVILNGSNIGLRIGAAGTPGGSGPVYFENIWVDGCDGHNVYCDDDGTNIGAFAGLCFVNLTSEHQASNKSAIYLKGTGHAAQWNFYNVHIEMGNSATGRRGITIDGASHVHFHGVQLLADPATVSAGIVITNVAQNVGIQIKGVYNPNLINPVIQDLLNGGSLGAVNVTSYETPDCVMQGGLTVRDPRADGTTNRPFAMYNGDGSRLFGWYFPDSSNWRMRYFTSGVNLLNFDNSGNGFVYNPMTFQSLVTYQSAIKGSGARGAAPSSGTHVVGEIVFNADPIASGFIGWVCVTAGTPGTWKSWGAISA